MQCGLACRSVLHQKFLQRIDGLTKYLTDGFPGRSLCPKGRNHEPQSVIRNGFFSLDSGSSGNGGLQLRQYLISACFDKSLRQSAHFLYLRFKVRFKHAPLLLLPSKRRLSVLAKVCRSPAARCMTHGRAGRWRSQVVVEYRMWVRGGRCLCGAAEDVSRKPFDAVGSGLRLRQGGNFLFLQHQLADLFEVFEKIREKQETLKLAAPPFIPASERRGRLVDQANAMWACL